MIASSAPQQHQLVQLRGRGSCRLPGRRGPDRVTGTVVQPDDPEAPARFTVDGLEVLEASPAAVLFDLVLERWGSYVSVFDADRDAVPVFTMDGTWVGEAASPDAIGDLIEAHENGGTR
jgi:hypothetical protein